MLKQALSDLEEAGSSQSHHSGNSNEDDCYGIPGIGPIPHNWASVKDEEEEEELEPVEDLSRFSQWKILPDFLKEKGVERFLTTSSFLSQKESACFFIFQSFHNYIRSTVHYSTMHLLLQYYT
ncbi:hypothetical protein NL676_021545 [Syzygium grande]|nr:hypothetical protein NL676_021545 [Syzygium grande]